MRSLSSWSTLPFVFLIAALAGCPGADDAATAKTGRDAAAGNGGQAGQGEGSAGAGAGDGGVFDPGPPKGGGSAGTGIGTGAAGSLGGDPPGDAGAAGAGSPANAGGAGSSDNESKLDEDVDGCVGSFQAGAPWPAAGRCSARQGNSPVPGPKTFGGLAQLALESAITASPVIDAAGNVYVVNAQGLTRLDPLLTKKTPLYAKAPITAAPVITALGTVVALTVNGVLVSAPVDGDEATPLAYEQAPNEATSGFVSSLAVDAGGKVWFASPSGNVYVVDPATGKADFKNLGPGVAVGTSSIAISTQGDLAIGTNKGLFVLPHGQTTTTAIPFAGAAVSRTPVFLPAGAKTLVTAVYADDAGIVHNVTVDGAGKAEDKTVKNAPKLGLTPGAPAVLSGSRTKVFIGDGPHLRLLDATDGPAVVDTLTVALSAAGPIVGAAATDSIGQLFVPSTDGSVYRLAPNPKELASFLTGDSFLTEGSLATAPALNGTKLYFGSSDKNVYLITDEKITTDAPAPGAP